MTELLEEEYYVGQVFEGIYPPEAANWCNQNGTCHIEEIESIEKNVEVKTEDIDGNITTTTELQTVRCFKIVENPQPTAEEIRQRLDMLSLTAADVERALYKAKGIDFDDIVAMVTSNPPENLDIKALKIELKANNFYRGNPYISQIATLLGITGAQLDEFFQTNDYTKLIQTDAVTDD